MLKRIDAFLNNLNPLGAAMVMLLGGCVAILAIGCAVRFGGL